MVRAPPLLLQTEVERRRNSVQNLFTKGTRIPLPPPDIFGMKLFWMKLYSAPVGALGVPVGALGVPVGALGVPVRALGALVFPLGSWGSHWASFPVRFFGSRFVRSVPVSFVGSVDWFPGAQGRIIPNVSAIH